MPYNTSTSGPAVRAGAFTRNPEYERLHLANIRAEGERLEQHARMAKQQQRATLDTLLGQDEIVQRAMASLRKCLAELDNATQARDAIQNKLDTLQKPSSQVDVVAWVARRAELTAQLEGHTHLVDAAQLAYNEAQDAVSTARESAREYLIKQAITQRNSIIRNGRAEVQALHEQLEQTADKWTAQLAENTKHLEALGVPAGRLNMPDRAGIDMNDVNLRPHIVPVATGGQLLSAIG